MAEEAGALGVQRTLGPVRLLVLVGPMGPVRFPRLAGMGEPRRVAGPVGLPRVAGLPKVARLAGALLHPARTSLKQSWHAAESCSTRSRCFTASA